MHYLVPSQIPWSITATRFSVNARKEIASVESCRVPTFLLRSFLQNPRSLTVNNSKNVSILWLICEFYYISKYHPFVLKSLKYTLNQSVSFISKICSMDISSFWEPWTFFFPFNKSSFSCLLFITYLFADFIIPHSKMFVFSCVCHCYFYYVWKIVNVPFSWFLSLFPYFLFSVSSASYF